MLALPTLPFAPSKRPLRIRRRGSPHLVGHPLPQRRWRSSFLCAATAASRSSGTSEGGGAPGRCSRGGRGVNVKGRPAPSACAGQRLTLPRRL